MKNLTNFLLRRFAGLTGPVALLLFTALLSASGVSMVWSILAVYANSLGASTTMVAILVAGFSTARLVVKFRPGISRGGSAIAAS